MTFLTKRLLSFTLLLGVTVASSQVQASVKKQRAVIALNDTTFVNLKEYSNDFVYDMKYATEDNCLRQQLDICISIFFI
jgi:D-alanyl-D-alanine dipeptidase